MIHWQCPADMAQRDVVAGPFQPVPELHKWWQHSSHWMSMVLGPDCDVHNAGVSPKEASVCGIYMLFGKADDLLYVGRSDDINSRICAHYWRRSHGGIPFSAFVFMALPSYAIRDIEVAHIHALEPPYNRLFERIYWQQHEAAVSKIQAVWGPKQ